MSDTRFAIEAAKALKLYGPQPRERYLNTSYHLERDADPGSLSASKTIFQIELDRAKGLYGPKDDGRYLNPSCFADE